MAYLATLMMHCIQLYIDFQARMSGWMIPTNGNGIGVNYGMLGDNLPRVGDAISLMRRNNIGKVRLFQAHHEAQWTLTNTGMEVIVGVGNGELRAVSSDMAAADGWVRDNIVQFVNAGTNIKYIAVGNEVLAPENRGNYQRYLIQAMRNIQQAVNRNGMGNRVKVSTTHAMSVIGVSYPPSQGAFTGDNVGTMSTILRFLADNGGAPLMINIYPYFSYRDNRGQISLDYALIGANAAPVHDGGRVYTSLFDAQYDSVLSACERLGFPNVPVVVTETGWPSAGEASATVDNARAYINNLIRHVRKGTPKRPGTPIDAYIFAMFNENRKTGDEIERHFGLFNPNMSPAYPVNFNP